MNIKICMKKKALKQPIFVNNAYKIYRLKGNRLVKIERWIFLSHLETVKVPEHVEILLCIVTIHYITTSHKKPQK